MIFCAAANRFVQCENRRYMKGVDVATACCVDVSPPTAIRDADSPSE